VEWGEEGDIDVDMDIDRDGTVVYGREGCGQWKIFKKITHKTGHMGISTDPTTCSTHFLLATQLSPILVTKSTGEEGVCTVHLLRLTWGRKTAFSQISRGPSP